MTQQNSSRFGTAFTETIEAREGVTTGISAHDRAHTIRVAIDPVSTANDLARPGHVFPLRARKGGVLVRAGQTEASVDLARMAGLIPAGVICEIMKDDGTMARVPDLIEFCNQHGMKMLTVAELIRYRLQNERYIVRVAESEVPTPYGDFHMIAYESEVAGGESHIALVKGDVSKGEEPVLVRVHSHCLAGDKKDVAR
jgi:3,4-dihydroxy 2-butanone 4-phosphate synthase/GTP cyclohydrolase II